MPRKCPLSWSGARISGNRISGGEPRSTVMAFVSLPDVVQIVPGPEHYLAEVMLNGTSEGSYLRLVSQRWCFSTTTIRPPDPAARGFLGSGALRWNSVMSRSELAGQRLKSTPLGESVVLEAPRWQAPKGMPVSSCMGLEKSLW